ncbi:MAG: shikimate dehydrogenase [Dactylosporangium sp.]|nr:shikimate dehydrogenase [Dactylosporangium sp.]
MLEPVSSASARLYFVGVTTSQSNIQGLFPVWAARLGIDAQLVGRDLRLDAEPAEYRACIEGIRDDPAAAGALVTTHKAAVHDHAGDMFEVLDEYAQTCREVSCVVRAGRGLRGFAKDPITAGLAMDHMFTTAGPVAGRHVVCFGAGGAGVAITVRLLTLEEPPQRLVLVDRDPQRIALAREVHRELGTDVDVEYHVHSDQADNDRILSASPARSFVINATGLGKDLPGSPISRHAQFPAEGLVWDLNYRGALDFLTTAAEQTEHRRIEIHDGWRYFLHGWTEVIAEVFGIEMTSERFDDLAAAADPLREAGKPWSAYADAGRAG